MGVLDLVQSLWELLVKGNSGNLWPVELKTEFIKDGVVYKCITVVDKVGKA